MADYRITAALNAAMFPFTTRLHQRSVMIGQLDGRLRDPASSPQSNYDNNPNNIPQMVYCENIMPTADGVRSVGYVDNVQAAFPGAGTGDDVFILRDNGDNSWFFSPARGMNYVTTALGAPWVSMSPLPGAPLAPAAVTPSFAYVNGTMYVLYPGGAGFARMLRWDAGVFTDVSAFLALSGLQAFEIRCICASGNYMIALDYNNQVHWSNLTNPIDFAPSTLTGAGLQIPIDIKGPALRLSTIPGGFVIHCTENAIAALYTNNSVQPWIFREIKNSGGLTTIEGIARDISTGSVYMYGRYGLQSLNLREAENIHPDLTDFIEAGVVETFNNATNLLAVSHNARIFTKLAFLGGRYLCISYGTTNSYGPFDYVLIYDTAFRRWGKLKITHYDIFTNVDAVGLASSLYALKGDGSCSLIVLDDRAATRNGVTILGRYQLSRSSQICSQELELEVTDTADTVTATIAANFDGTTLGALLPMVLASSSDNYRLFQKQVEAENLSFIIKGDYTLATALLTFTKGARM